MSLSGAFDSNNQVDYRFSEAVTSPFLQILPYREVEILGSGDNARIIYAWKVAKSGNEVFLIKVPGNVGAQSEPSPNLHEIKDTEIQSKLAHLGPGKLEFTVTKGEWMIEEYEYYESYGTASPIKDANPRQNHQKRLISLLKVNV